MTYAGILLLAQLTVPLWKAQQAVEAGLADLRTAAAAAVETKRVSHGQSGRWGWSAERDVLLGMLAHIETSSAESHVQIIHTESGESADRPRAGDHSETTHSAKGQDS